MEVLSVLQRSFATRRPFFVGSIFGTFGSIPRMKRGSIHSLHSCEAYVTMGEGLGLLSIVIQDTPQGQPAEPRDEEHSTKGDGRRIGHG